MYVCMYVYMYYAYNTYIEYVTYILISICFIKTIYLYIVDKNVYIQHKAWYLYTVYRTQNFNITCKIYCFLKYSQPNWKCFHPIFLFYNEKDA